MNHIWVKSELGHGELQCTECSMTNREAVALRKVNQCDGPLNNPALPDAEVRVQLRAILYCCMKLKGILPTHTKTEDAAVDAMKLLYDASRDGHP